VIVSWIMDELSILGISTWNDGDSSSITERNGQPSLIILCTWTGANDRHIRSYREKYRKKFPSTPGMLITTTIVDLCIRDSKSKQKRLRPAVEWIAKRLPKLRTGKQILMHVFSEGGSNKACELAEAYLTTENSRLPVSALILDSTPGRPHFRRLCDAASKSLSPSACVRVASLPLCYVMVGIMWVVYCGIKGFERNIISMTRERLLDSSVWDPNALRCYIYSISDALIDYRDIETHAEDSENCRIPVTLQKFETSGHVMHAKLHKIAYWDAVWDTWSSHIPSEVATERASVVSNYVTTATNGYVVPAAPSQNNALVGFDKLSAEVTNVPPYAAKNPVGRIRLMRA
jgi:hypothetical protein